MKTIFLVFVLTALFLSACSSDSSSSLTADKEPVTIGATLALSGRYAYIGEYERRGLEDAIAHVNANGGINGRELKLIYEDNAGDAKQAVTSVEKFISTNNVDVVFSAFTHITQAVAPIATQNKKPLIYQSSLPDMAKSSPYVFRHYMDAGDHGAVVARIVSQEGYKKVAYLTEISDPCKLYEEHFLVEAKKCGIVVSRREEFKTDEKDFRTILLKLNLDDVEALVTCTWRHEDLLYPQMKELGLLKTPMVGFISPFLPAADTPEMHALYEENGAVITWYGLLTPSTNEQKAYFASYQAKHGELPRGDVLNSYDFIIAASDALKTCDNTGKLRDSDCFSQEMVKTNTVGVSGPLLFNQDRVSQQSVSVMTMKDGKWVDYSLN